MHAETPTSSDKRRIDLKTMAFIMVHITMLGHATILTVDYLNTNEDKIMLSNVNNIDVPTLTQAATNLVMVTSIIVSLIVLHYVYEPYTDQHKFKIDAMFSFITTAISIIYNLIWTNMKPTATLYKALITAFTAVLVNVIRCYWIKLDKTETIKKNA